MVIIGITGGSGSGKSCFARLLAESLDAFVLDADQVYHELIGPGKTCTRVLSEIFGDCILSQDGSVSRVALADLVFGDSAEAKRRLTKLNTITHQFVREEFEKRLVALRQQGKSFVLMDVPLLFEAGFDTMCDDTIGVLADDSIRLSRIIQRDGLSHALAEKRLAALPSSDYYTARCGYIVYNNTDENHLKTEVQRIKAMLFCKYNQH